MAPVTLKIKLSNGNTHSVELKDGTAGITVEQLKQQMADIIGIAGNEQRVVFKGRVLKDPDMLTTIGLEEGDTIHVVKGRAPGAPASTPAPSAPQQSQQPAPSTPLQQANQSPPQTTGAQNQAAANPYAALFGAGAMGGGMGAGNKGAGAGVGAAPPMMWPGMGGGAGMGMGMGGADEQQMMQQMMQNPAMMQMAAQMMQANPQMMQEIARNHPMLQSMPPEQRDAVLQMMSDPQVLQQSMGMMAAMNAQRGQQGGQQGAPQHGGFGGMGAGGMGQIPPGFFAPPQPQGDPRTLYANQLEQLKAMGFPNEEANLAALVQSQGSVDFAIERLLNS